ncbi:MAG: hypothetical protein ACKVQC_05025 [Elusimicrobiota bacterium]
MATFLLVVFFWGATHPSRGFTTPLPESPPVHFLRELKINSERDYQKDSPEYIFKNLTEPLLLEPGLYRFSFSLRRGHYPRKGLFYNSYGLFRIEIWDTTDDVCLNKREIQVGDFSKTGEFETKWMDISTSGRKGHTIEPRVFWYGLINGAIKEIKISRLTFQSDQNLEEKARQFSQLMQNEFLENGFVVSRKTNNEADEIGDATTYTSFYAASLAWKYSVTKDEWTYSQLENVLETLHSVVKGTEDSPILVRYVDSDGNPHPKNPSKDVYTAYFLAASSIYPVLRPSPLKKRLKEDIERISYKLINDNLIVMKNSQNILSLTPYLTESEIRIGIKKLFAQKKVQKNTIRTLKQISRFLPFSDLWPGLRVFKKALLTQDEDIMFNNVIPTLNGVTQLIARARDLLKEQSRNDLISFKTKNPYFPAEKLAVLLTKSLKKFPPEKNKVRFKTLEDLKILSGNSILTLHILKTAATITNRNLNKEYYLNNLFTQNELLKTAIYWFGIEEKLGQLIAGNKESNLERGGYLSVLALYNLIQLEKDSQIRKSYMVLLDRWWEINKNEDNPMAHALYASCFLTENSKPEIKSRIKNEYADFIRYKLSLYPMNREGFGPDYWRESGSFIGEKLGGGVSSKYSREPLPISHRPKDSFLWQRNPRRLEGDEKKQYPPTDYLFVYWMARANGILPTPATAETVLGNH